MSAPIQKLVRFQANSSKDDVELVLDGVDIAPHAAKNEERREIILKSLEDRILSMAPDMDLAASTECVAVMGQEQMGKSTLLRNIKCEFRPHFKSSEAGCFEPTTAGVDFTVHWDPRKKVSTVLMDTQGVQSILPDLALELEKNGGPDMRDISKSMDRRISAFSMCLGVPIVIFMRSPVGDQVDYLVMLNEYYNKLREGGLLTEAPHITLAVRADGSRFNEDFFWQQLIKAIKARSAGADMSLFETRFPIVIMNACPHDMPEEYERRVEEIRKSVWPAASKVAKKFGEFLTRVAVSLDFVGTLRNIEDMLASSNQLKKFAIKKIIDKGKKVYEDLAKDETFVTEAHHLQMLTEAKKVLASSPLTVSDDAAASELETILGELFDSTYARCTALSSCGSAHQCKKNRVPHANHFENESHEILCRRGHSQGVKACGSPVPLCAQCCPYRCTCPAQQSCTLNSGHTDRHVCDDCCMQLCKCGGYCTNKKHHDGGHQCFKSECGPCVGHCPCGSACALSPHDISITCSCGRWKSTKCRVSWCNTTVDVDCVSKPTSALCQAHVNVGYLPNDHNWWDHFSPSGFCDVCGADIEFAERFKCAGGCENFDLCRSCFQRPSCRHPHDLFVTRTSDGSLNIVQRPQHGDCVVS